MASFTPPVADEVPPVEATTGGPAYLLFRHYKQRARGRNVYYKTTGTATDEDPQNDGTTTDPWSLVAHAFWGGHAAEQVTAAEQAALEAAGFTVDP